MPDGFFRLKTTSAQVIAVFISIVSSLTIASSVYAEEIPLDPHPHVFSAPPPIPFEEFISEKFKNFDENTKCDDTANTPSVSTSFRCFLQKSKLATIRLGNQLEGFYTHRHEIKDGKIVTIPGSEITSTDDKDDRDDYSSQMPNTEYPLREMISFGIERSDFQNALETSTLMQFTTSDNTIEIDGDVFSGLQAKITTTLNEFSIPLTVDELNQLGIIIANECFSSQSHGTLECEDTFVAHLSSWAFHAMEDPEKGMSHSEL